MRTATLGGAGWCLLVGAGCSGLFQTEQIFKYTHGRIANDHLKNGLGTVGILPRRLFGAPPQNNRAATLLCGSGGGRASCLRQDAHPPAALLLKKKSVFEDSVVDKEKVEDPSANIECREGGASTRLWPWLSAKICHSPIGCRCRGSMCCNWGLNPGHPRNRQKAATLLSVQTLEQQPA